MSRAPPAVSEIRCKGGCSGCRKSPLPRAPRPAAPSRGRWCRGRSRCGAVLSIGFFLPPFLLYRRLGRGKTRHGDPVGRAAHVVEAQLVAELDRVRLAAVLAADAHLELGPRLSAQL